MAAVSYFLCQNMILSFVYHPGTNCFFQCYADDTVLYRGVCWILMLNVNHFTSSFQSDNPKSRCNFSFWLLSCFAQLRLIAHFHFLLFWKKVIHAFISPRVTSFIRGSVEEMSPVCSPPVQNGFSRESRLCRSDLRRLWVLELIFLLLLFNALHDQSPSGI